MHRVNQQLSALASFGMHVSRIRIPATVLGLLLVIATARAMPPPAPGNTRGLPQSVRTELQQVPGLFYPRKGFRDVIERQKAMRQQPVAELQRKGHSLQSAEMLASSRITTTRFCPVLAGQYADKVTPDWPVSELVDELFSVGKGLPRMRNGAI